MLPNLHNPCLFQVGRGLAETLQSLGPHPGPLRSELRIPRLAEHPNPIAPTHRPQACNESFVASDAYGHEAVMKLSGSRVERN